MRGYKIKNDIELVGTFKKLAQAYQEIAVIKMQRVRDSVVSTRSFLERLSFVFSDVKKSYSKEIEKLLKDKKGKHHIDSKYPNNGKTVKVILSSNTKMYGDIINRLFIFFAESLNNSDSDIVVVGKLGKELFEQRFGKNKAYTFFDLPDTGVVLADLQKIAVFLIQYETVEVFYGKFENVAKQTPVSFKITGEEELTTAQDQGVEKMGFFFEPSLDTIITFFQDQVFSSLFRQSISEGELARFASRIMAMEEALGNIEKNEKLLRSEERKIKKIMVNKKQLERISSLSLWR